MRDDLGLMFSCEALSGAADAVLSDQGLEPCVFPLIRRVSCPYSSQSSLRVEAPNWAARNPDGVRGQEVGCHTSNASIKNSSMCRVPGASDGIRTRFPLLGRQMLDQMSFTRRPARRRG